MMELDKRFRPGGEELGPPQRRRRSSAPSGGSSRARALLLALLLLAVVVVGVHISPTQSSLARRQRRHLRQRHLQAPAWRASDSGVTSSDAGSLFAAADRLAGEPTAALQGGPVAAGGEAGGEAAADVEEDDEAAGRWGASQQQQQQPAEAGVSAERTLSFEVCNGFAHQRVALLSGIVLAAEVNRSMVLPRLLRDGSRPSSGGNLVDFGEVFEREAFVQAMRREGLHIAAEAPALRNITVLQLGRQYNYMRLLATDYGEAQHLRLDCPAFRVPPDLLVKHEKLVFAALDALKPVQRLSDTVQRIVKSLLTLGQSSDCFNVLYLNTGESWPEHCEQWNRLTNGLASDNCANNTDTPGDALELHRVGREVPLLVAAIGSRLNDTVVQAALGSLSNHGYKAVLQGDVFKEVPELASLGQEEAALVDFYVALRCQQFVGNSVSTSSALLIMERWHTNRFATYYNGGNIPLEAFLPLFPMPWVFTYNDWSSGTEYDQMVKGAVTSAIEAARMRPFCMYSGSQSSPMYQWLVGRGVRIIRHDPAWKDALVKEGRRHRDLYTRTASHLYKSDGAILGAFQRIDIPILREFDQYNYVLFTDCDVFFRKQMKLIDWGVPLPQALGMGYERYDLFPYNDGVMLWNMPYMVKTNKAFTSWLLSNKNGMYFPGYGPLDQGAFNQYYEKEVSGKPISKNFNAMVYHNFRPEARIVHVHGPKPNHYLEYLRTNKCQFKDMCELGFAGGVCMYFAEYERFVPEWDQVHSLVRLCGNMRAGVWHP
ncbi:hypothetical protein ABPG75_001255 [Micractinium tetrahymenae]